MSTTLPFLRTKLSPPRLHRRLLPRPQLTARLREALDYRLTLVEAGTGYGKSTALATLVATETSPNLAWYSVDASDADPQQYLSYLQAAFKTVLPALTDLPSALLQDSATLNNAQWSQVLDALVNALAEAAHNPLVLVLDDYHFVADSLEINQLTNRFISYLPAQIHVVIATRHALNLPALVQWQAKGEALTIGRDAFTFSRAEIDELFHTTYGLTLSPTEIDLLADKTEGWPIALQLVRQDLQNPASGGVAKLFDQGPASLNALFEYLARDILDRQPPDLVQFLLQTSVLRELTPESCAAVTGSSPLDSSFKLRRLLDLDLFIVALSERQFRYHHLFHDFLHEQAAVDPDQSRAHHRRAATYYQALNPEEALHHWLAAQAYSEAATTIESMAETALHGGRLDSVAGWIDSLPPDVLGDHPYLQYSLGDVYRLRSQFDEALQWYAAAERAGRARNDSAGISRALRGQALIYLDTVRPAQAESLLQEALRLSDGTADIEARTRLLELLAENKLNLGKPIEAEQLRLEAMSLREAGRSEDTLSVRVKLRTGRLAEARQILETWLETERREAEQGQVHAPRSHRETALILSLIDSFQGQATRAFELAQEGIALGEKTGSPFITAVGQMRLGHAWQLKPGSPIRVTADEAIRCYQAAISLGDRLAVRRTRAESMWGLTRAYGFSGDLDSAARAAAEGIEICQWAGDLWLNALIDLTWGASLVLAGNAPAAIETLSRVLIAFRNCSDSFGRAATRLWLSLAYFDLKQKDNLEACLENLLALCEEHGYDSLFTAATLLGPPDPHRLVPLLIAAREARIQTAYVTRLLTRLNLSEIKVHPGYQLRIQSLGGFRVWRGSIEIDSREWKREKARQLFQLLLIRRGRPLQREEITESLWPDLSPEAAARDFKVALNALNKTLEPTRDPDSPFAFIIREGAAYVIRPEADLWFDATEFERETDSGLQAADPARATGYLRTALALYSGDFLPDALYEDWASAERERLLALYLRSADKLASLFLRLNFYAETLQTCELILKRDSCWERAYRLMMASYTLQGNRPQALRIYQRCVETLHHELNVTPSAVTETLRAQIAQAAPLDVTVL